MTQRAIDRDFIDAPRIEVAIAPDEKGANVNVPSTLLNVRLVMHMPGEEPSMGLLISGRQGSCRRAMVAESCVMS
jgi:hypothetical protein